MTALTPAQKERQRFARSRARRIGGSRLDTTWHSRLATAFTLGDHQALGYETFEDYCEHEIIQQLPTELHDRARSLLAPASGARCRSVYFVQSVDGGLIKIGIASNVAARLSGMQTGSPVKLRVIGVIPDARSTVEAELHERFATARRHGEWFEPTPELLAYIAEHAS